MNKFLFLSEYSQPIYRKCELCKRVKDVLFRLDVTNSEAAKMIVGSLDLCKNCAQNIGEIIQKGG